MEKGGPLSVRIASGRPHPSKADSKPRFAASTVLHEVGHTPFLVEVQRLVPRLQHDAEARANLAEAWSETVDLA